MGGVPVKHHTHGKVGRRRSHLALKKTSLVVCPTCGGPRRPHETCAQCGAFQTHAAKSAGAPVVQKEKKSALKKEMPVATMEETNTPTQAEEQEEMPSGEPEEKIDEAEMPKEAEAAEMEKMEEDQEKKDDSQT